MKSPLKFFFHLIKNYSKKKYENKLFISLNKLKILEKDFFITLVDIGAAGKIEPRWKSISRHLNYIGFEPDIRSRKSLKNDSGCNSYVIYPNAVWHKKTKLKINLTKNPKVSSFYKPNFNLINLFPIPERYQIDTTVNIDSVTLDSLKIPSLDFIKIDVQGGELNVLKGSKESLNKCFGLKIEVEFIELYNDQPLFGDVSNFLREKNFQFIDFINLCRWERSEHNGFGQCIFGDALFLKSPEYMISKYRGNYTLFYKYLAICLLYNRFDLIDRLVFLSDDNFKKIIEPFIKSLNYFKRKFKRLKLFNKITNNLLQIFYKNSRSFIEY